MFGLTRTALAQMMAWGLVGGDVSCLGQFHGLGKLHRGLVQ